MDTLNIRPVKYIGLSLLMVLFISAVSCEDDSASVQPPDEETAKEAIGNVLMTLGEGFARNDAELATSIYTPETQWLNAFGDWNVGRQAIREELEGVFGSSEFNSGGITKGPTATIRILKPGVAVAWFYQEIEGQKYPNGVDMRIRKNHSLVVLLQEDGEWVVEAQVFMDENLIPELTGLD